MQEQQHGGRRGDEAIMGPKSAWGLIVSSEAGWSDSGCFAGGLCVKFVLGWARSFQ